MESFFNLKNWRRSSSARAASPEAAAAKQRRRRPADAAVAALRQNTLRPCNRPRPTAAVPPTGPATAAAAREWPPPRPPTSDSPGRGGGDRPGAGHRPGAGPAGSQQAQQERAAAAASRSVPPASSSAPTSPALLVDADRAASGGRPPPRALRGGAVVVAAAIGGLDATGPRGRCLRMRRRSVRVRTTGPRSAAPWHADGVGNVDLRIATLGQAAPNAWSAGRGWERPMLKESVAPRRARAAGAASLAPPVGPPCARCRLHRFAPAAEVRVVQKPLRRLAPAEMLGFAVEREWAHTTIEPAAAGRRRFVSAVRRHRRPLLAGGDRAAWSARAVDGRLFSLLATSAKVVRETGHGARRDLLARAACCGRSSRTSAPTRRAAADARRRTVLRKRRPTRYERFGPRASADDKTLQLVELDFCENAGRKKVATDVCVELLGRPQTQFTAKKHGK